MKFHSIIAMPSHSEGGITVKHIDTDPIAEVRRNRELLLERYGGIDGLHRHMEEERPSLEKHGWQFVSVEEVLARKRARVSTGADSCQ